MRLIALFAMLIFPISGSLQIDRPLPYKPLHRDLFRRAQSGDLIALVTVVQRRMVGARVAESEPPDLGKVLGGMLFTLQVEDILCAKTDFDLRARKAPSAPQNLFVFKKYDKRFYEAGSYELGQRYLGFLTQHPEQKDLATKYKLDAGTTYYEAFEGERGLIPLAGEEPAPVAKIRQFCQALRLANPNAKIRGLRKLLGSDDPELERAARQAIDFLEREMMWR